MMEHEDVRAALEVAAVEPGGLDLLAAGESGEAAAVSHHLAGCAGCSDELARLRRVEALLRPAIALGPPPELRARTLDYVRAVGRQRAAPGVVPSPPDAGSAAAPVAADAPPAADAARTAVITGATPGASRSAATIRRARRAAWPAAVAAALVIGLAAGILAFGRTPAPDTTDASVALTEVSHESATLLGAPDAARVTLWDSSGAARGSIVVAKSAGRMVAVAVDLPDPGVGREYACWVEVGGVRTRLGTMWLTGTVAWWNGPAALPDSLGPGARFGVSLVTVGSGGAGDPVLTGRL
jgi:hypothetical protein